MLSEIFGGRRWRSRARPEAPGVWGLGRGGVLMRVFILSNLYYSSKRLMC